MGGTWWTQSTASFRGLLPTSTSERAGIPTARPTLFSAKLSSPRFLHQFVPLEYPIDQFRDLQKPTAGSER